MELAILLMQLMAVFFGLMMAGTISLFALDRFTGTNFIQVNPVHLFSGSLALSFLLAAVTVVLLG